MDTAKIYAIKLYDLAKAHRHDSLIMMAYNNLYVIEQVPEQAIVYMEKTMEMARRLQNDDIYISTLSNLTLYLQSLGRIPEAHQKLQHLNHIADSTHNPQAQEQSYLNKANLYLLIQNYPIVHQKK